MEAMIVIETFYNLLELWGTPEEHDNAIYTGPYWISCHETIANITWKSESLFYFLYVVRRKTDILGSQ